MTEIEKKAKQINDGLFDKQKDSYKEEKFKPKIEETDKVNNPPKKKGRKKKGS